MGEMDERLGLRVASRKDPVATTTKKTSGLAQVRMDAIVVAANPNVFPLCRAMRHPLHAPSVEMSTRWETILQRRPSRAQFYAIMNFLAWVPLIPRVLW